jgi:sterol desaturase/sphingolipid hydroxylase (fatty acid hydroxylase superfamily)
MRKPHYDPETRLFESDLLEGMTRTNPIWPAVFWVPVAIGSLVYAAREGVNPWLLLPLFLFGVLTWSLAEYILHRWVFHYVPRSPRVRRFYYLVHQVHHEKQEWDRLTMPITLALVIAIPILATLYAVFGQPMMWAVFPGVVVGYLGYDYLHFYSHFGKPKNAYLKGLRRRHNQHHHAFPDRWFGVSSPLWDYVFRTHVRPGERPTGAVYPGNLVEWPRPDFSHLRPPEIEAAE